MWARLRVGDSAMPWLWAAVALSFALWLFALWFELGIGVSLADADGRYRTYFEHANWWPYPIFFLSLAPGLWLSWRPFLDAWRRLAETGVLQGADGGADEDALAKVRQAVGRRRGIAVTAALLIALFVNVIDRAPLYRIYSGAAALPEQQAFACADPGPFVKWILEAHQGSGFLCDHLPVQDAGGDPAPAETASPPPKGIAPPADQLLFTMATAAQQFLIVFFSALAVLQILLHTVMFAAFERLEAARARGLRLQLNCGSPVGEFGLEHWNHALNNFYWAVCPAMLAVFLSRATTAPEDYNPGQEMLGIAVPTCLLAPMVATIIVRQARLPQAWASLQADGSVQPEDFRRQQLWPLERNWSSKLGIFLAFVLAALSLGFELINLIPL